jgi:hypothetical protein
MQASSSVILYTRGRVGPDDFSLRINDLLEEAWVNRFFMQNFRCEREGLELEQELENDNVEGEYLNLIDVFHSLIDILLGCHIAGGPSVINNVFSVSKAMFCC